MGIFRSKRKRAAVRGARSLVPSAYHIEFQNVWKKLGGVEILRGVDLQIHRGETFVVIGQSGTGKSVSLKHIIGLMQPDYGRVLINGIDRTKLTERERLESYKQFGYLFQSGALINWMTLYDNVALPLREHTNLPEVEIRSRVMEKLRMVNLEEHGQKYPSEISGGMKKRAGLARAIVREPEIVLYDEPTSGLDPVMSREVDRLIIKLARELQVTNVLVTHDMESAYLCADRIGMLYQGRMLQVGTPEEIRDSRDPVVQAFITGGIIPTDPDAEVALPSEEVQARRTRHLTQLRRTRASKREEAVPEVVARVAADSERFEPEDEEVREAEPAGSSSSSSRPTQVMDHVELDQWELEPQYEQELSGEPTKVMAAEELAVWPDDLETPAPEESPEPTDEEGGHAEAAAVAGDDVDDDDDDVKADGEAEDQAASSEDVAATQQQQQPQQQDAPSDNGVPLAAPNETATTLNSHNTNISDEVDVEDPPSANGGRSEAPVGKSEDVENGDAHHHHHSQADSSSEATSSMTHTRATPAGDSSPSGKENNNQSDNDDADVQQRSATPE